MTNVFVDTDILIDYTKGHSRDLESLLTSQERGETELYINPVVIAEFLTDQALRVEAKREKAQEFLQLFTFKEITKQTGYVAGELLREKKVHSLGDAFIAATCITNGFQLATRNNKHFSGIPALHLHTRS